MITVVFPGRSGEKNGISKRETGFIFVLNHEDKTMRMKAELCNINVGIIALAYFSLTLKHGYWSFCCLSKLQEPLMGKRRTGTKYDPVEFFSWTIILSLIKSPRVEAT